ncbi:YraN family protein [Patescibacteria group bacterium]|nr:YraN family protein [Patescibacteria group bacterium]
MSSSVDSRRQLGRFGEDQAAGFLVKKGYRELARNLVLPQGEIDLLMDADSAVVLVEVKSQTSSSYAHPLFKVDRKKQAKLRLLARVISARYPDRNIQVDAVTVEVKSGKPRITHYPNVLT